MYLFVCFCLFNAVMFYTHSIIFVVNIFNLISLPDNNNLRSV